MTANDLTFAQIYAARELLRPEIGEYADLVTYDGVEERGGKPHAHFHSCYCGDWIDYFVDLADIE